MSFLDLAARRVSVRKYQDRPVPGELLEKVLEAGRLAPSACNKQPWHFVVISDPDVRRRLAEAYNKDWFIAAPVILAVLVERAKAWTRADGISYAWVDAAIAMDHITLGAADLGLGTCWIGAFHDAPLRHLLGLPEGIDAVAMTPLGYPADAGRPKSRMPLDQLVHYNHW